MNTIPWTGGARKRFATDNCRLVASFAVALLLVAAPQANAGSELTVESFNGDYAGAILGTRGALPVAILGILSFNGDGTGNADTVWNVPGQTYTERKVVPTRWSFRYEVDDHGVAVMKAPSLADIYLVASRTRRMGHGRPRLVLELQGMSGRLETSGGTILAGTGKRLPHDARFDLRSLRGLYGGIGVGEGGRQTTAIGYTRFDGAGRGSERSLWNVPDADNVFERQLAPLSSEFEYSIGANGIGKGRIEQSDGFTSEAWFVVTGARRQHGDHLATELFVIQNALDPIGGDLLFSPLSRLSN